jgi:actin related protein 2/3 complex subunit 2
MWSPAPPLELRGMNADALNANAGFVTFGNFYFPTYFFMFFQDIYLSTHKKRYQFVSRPFFMAVVSPRHVEGRKLDKTVWSLLTFHAYVSYHVKVRSLFFYQVSGSLK